MARGATGTARKALPPSREKEKRRVRNKFRIIGRESGGDGRAPAGQRCGMGKPKQGAGIGRASQFPRHRPRGILGR